MFRYESRAGGGPMQTLSSASRTCMASASAVECTATVAIPSSLQARSTRSAISPRLAIRILSNIYSIIINGSPYSTGWPSSNRICVTVPPRGSGPARSRAPLSGSSALRLGADQSRQPGDGERITFDAKAADDRLRSLRDVGVVAEFLALMDVGDVHFDGRNANREDRIENRNRRGGVSRGVDYDPGRFLR